MLTEGTVAPEIVLKDKNSNEVKLSDFKGQKVVVYFYPKDNTPGCTRQACAFSNNFSKFEELNVKVIGISKDSEASHIRFADKYDLPFVLLSDPELKAIKDYDVWQEKKMYGKTSFGVVRSTYLIDENGVIEKVWKKAKPDTNAEEIIEYIENLNC
ncbi:MAG: thioredoxin-dependent thiol peroxidase [Escherichia coli]|nr:MAG: thioredoxin-dependent thiol peroxidase [Escherichia coli]